MNRPTNNNQEFLDCPRFRSEEDYDAYVESIQPHRELICPITQELMRDPVVAEDGYTYEKEAILRWFSVGRYVAVNPASYVVFLKFSEKVPSYGVVLTKTSSGIPHQNFKILNSFFFFFLLFVILVSPG